MEDIFLQQHTHTGMDQPKIKAENIDNKDLHTFSHVLPYLDPTSSDYWQTVFFIAPAALEIVDVRCRYNTAGGTGETVNIEKCDDGEGVVEGDLILSSGIALDGATKTSHVGTVNTINSKLTAGQGIGLRHGGGTYGARHLAVQITYKFSNKGNYQIL